MRTVVLSLVAVALVSYKLLIVFLRRRRLEHIGRLHPVRDSLVLASIFSTVEFPYLFGKGMGFALFRTYGIPSISKVLYNAGGFQGGAAKRVEDTDLLAREIMSHHPDAPRGSYALRRLNYIHSHYKIQNSDYLYTLTLFITSPIEWAQRYGFRKPTDAEKLAQYVVWHDIGVRMGIRDIPGSYQELQQFQTRYEEEHMVLADTNRMVADLTLDLIQKRSPALMRPLARRVAYALLDDRVREAMGFPEQPKWAQRLVHWAHRFVAGNCIAWLLPPRPLSWGVNRIHSSELWSTSFDPDELRKVRLQLDTPPVYKDGYRISHLGPSCPGQTGEAFPGDLLCPLSTLLQAKMEVYKVEVVQSCDQRVLFWLDASQLSPRLQYAPLAPARASRHDSRPFEERQLSEAVTALGHLVQRRSFVDSTLLYGLIKRRITEEDLVSGAKVHAPVAKSGHDSNLFLVNHLIRMYASRGRLEEATSVFAKRPKPDRYLWASILLVHATHEQPREAMRLYQQPRESMVKPDNHIFVGVLKACAPAKDLPAGREVHVDIMGAAEKLNVFVGTSLVNMDAKCLSLEDARQVNENLPSKNVATWNDMIAGYAQNGLGRQALDLYEGMQHERSFPT